MAGSSAPLGGSAAENAAGGTHLCGSFVRWHLCISSLPHVKFDIRIDGVLFTLYFARKGSSKSNKIIARTTLANKVIFSTRFAECGIGAAISAT